MAYCRATLEVPRPVDEVFAYLADFSNAEEWDPGVVSATRLEPGPVRVGSRFEVVSRFLGRDVRLVYHLVQLDPPGRIVFEGETADGVRSVDTILLEKAEDGTRIHYDAALTLPGLRYLVDLPLHLLFQWIGRQAVDGLERTLSRR